MSAEKENLIVSLIEKHKLVECQKTLDALKEDTPAKIVFLGSFSSGKTSLINCLLGTRLPVGTAPTTKTICFIEPSEEAKDRQKYFRFDNEGLCTEIDFDTFQTGLLDVGGGTVKVQVKPCALLREGTFFVDTPGEGSLSSESATTMAYLRNVDASVFCIQVQDGTVKKTVLDFIANEALKPAHKNMIFALTMVDLVSSTAAESVRQKVIADLRELASRGAFDAERIEDRVITVSAKDPEQAASTIKPVLEEFVYKRLDAIKKQRMSIEIAALEPRVKSALEDKLDNLSLDTRSYLEKKERLEHEKDDLRKKITDSKRLFDEFRALVAERVGAEYDARCGRLLRANGEECMAIGAEISEALSTSVQELLKKKLRTSSLVVSSAFSQQLSYELPCMLNRIDKVCHGVSEGLFVAATTILTAGATGAVAGGLTAAGGAAAGAGGGVAANVAKSAAKHAAAAAAKQAGKAAAQGTLVKVCSAAAKILNKINPFEALADVGSEHMKQNKIHEFRTVLVMACEGLCDSLENQYYDCEIQPLKDKIADVDANLAEGENELDHESEKYRAIKKTLKDDIACLG